MVTRRARLLRPHHEINGPRAARRRRRTNRNFFFFSLPSGAAIRNVLIN